MRLINRIIVDEKLNAKAKDLAPFLRMYEGCLMTAEQYRLFVKEVKGLLNELNAKHVRTKPFEVYGSNENCIYIIPEGKPEQRVASMSVHKVACVLDGSVGVCSVNDFMLVNTVDYDEAGC